MTKSTTLYLWDKEIKWVKKGVVTYVDGSQETYTEKQLTYMVTKEPQDLTTMRDNLLKNIVPEMLKVLEEHNIRKWDLWAILDTIISSFDYSYYTAMGKAFWTYKEWGYYESFREDIRMSDIKRLIGK